MRSARRRGSSAGRRSRAGREGRLEHPREVARGMERVDVEAVAKAARQARQARADPGDRDGDARPVVGRRIRERRRAEEGRHQREFQVLGRPRERRLVLPGRPGRRGSRQATRPAVARARSRPSRTGAAREPAPASPGPARTARPRARPDPTPSGPARSDCGRRRWPRTCQGAGGRSRLPPGRARGTGRAASRATTGRRTRAPRRRPPGRRRPPARRRRGRGRPSWRYGATG